MRQHPLTELILAAFDILQNNWSYQMIIGLLAKPGQLPGYRVFIQQRIDSLYEPIRRLAGTE